MRSRSKQEKLLQRIAKRAVEVEEFMENDRENDESEEEGGNASEQDAVLDDDAAAQLGDFEAVNWRPDLLGAAARTRGVSREVARRRQT